MEYLEQLGKTSKKSRDRNPSFTDRAEKQNSLSGGKRPGRKLRGNS